MHHVLNRVWEATARVLATGLGVGHFPMAPGTVGSLWGLPLVWALAQLDAAARVVIALALIVIGIPICDRAGRSLGEKDPGAVVFDEIAAFPVVFFGVSMDFTTGVLGFLLFRVFDIAKPWPMRSLERLPGGVGIMADDLAAGVYAGVCLWGIVRLWAAWT